jgi:energy-coupling factor transport system substrate-specific component
LSSLGLPAPVRRAAARSRSVAAGAAVLAAGAGAWTALDPGRAGLSLLLAAASLLIAGFAWLESGPGSAKEVAMVATLAAVAAAGRVLFAPVPGVQPLTVIAVAAGAGLGARVGVGVGALAALASNMFLGQGIWTPWQMLAWAACGVAGAALPSVLRRRVPFAFVCLVLGLGFSALMDLWEWLSFLPHTWPALVAQLARGFPFDAAHGVGNLVIALAVGPELRRVLERYGRRLRTEVSWA